MQRVTQPAAGTLGVSDETPIGKQSWPLPRAQPLAVPTTESDCGEDLHLANH